MIVACKNMTIQACLKFPTIHASRLQAGVRILAAYSKTNVVDSAFNVWLCPQARSGSNASQAGGGGASAILANRHPLQSSYFQSNESSRS